MTTISASQIVRVLPSVLNAGGNGLVLNGMILTNSALVPVGTVMSFPGPTNAAVAAFFGPTSTEAYVASIYFNGFVGSTKKPQTILFTQYPAAAVPAYVRGASVASVSIPTLQGYSGPLSVVLNGATYSASSINLSGATSYSAAAALIQSDLNASLPAAASFTGSIAPETAAFTGSIAGDELTVTAISNGSLYPGAAIAGSNVNACSITSQLSGAPGGAGVYAITVAQDVLPESMSATYGLLTVSAVASGTLSVGQILAGSNIGAGTELTALLTGSGLTGTYVVNQNQTVASEAMTSEGTPLVVGFNSNLGTFFIKSGFPGAISTVAYPTGSLATNLGLTAANGAVLSQGADAAQPGAFMTALTNTTQNWASFMLTFDPDEGNGSVQKQAFASWVNNQFDRYAYVAGDADVTPTLSNSAPTSFGSIVSQLENADGTIVIWDQTLVTLPAFICGAIASIDFAATNGRITFAFKGQAGLVANVTDATTANNLIANGYNFYGAYATANQNFLWFYPGSVSGDWEWADSYVNQIWLNSQLQLALMELLNNTKSIPYNAYGYALIEAACLDPIAAALNFGAIRAGVSLSDAQIAEVNGAAGVAIDGVLSTRGWYLQVLDPTPQVRQARGTPVCNFWYMDGESVQTITLNSIAVQ